MLRSFVPRNHLLWVACRSDRIRSLPTFAKPRSPRLSRPSDWTTGLQGTRSATRMSYQDQLLSTPGVASQPDEATKGFCFNHTMLRVKDATASLDFYTRVCGLRLLSKLDFEESKFSLYFLGFAADNEVPLKKEDRVEWTAKASGILELTHNYGTEDDNNFSGYHNGNKDPKGFGHIALSVPDVEAACNRFEELGVKFVKKPNEGSMKGIAFICDPDGYWIEIISAVNMRQMVSA